MAAKSANDQGDAPGRMITPGRVAAAIIVILLIAFVVDNTNKVRVGFVFFHAEVSLIWVLIITALLGLVVGVLVGRRSQRSGRSGA
jgi:uncharacterized integral membrane protein